MIRCFKCNGWRNEPGDLPGTLLRVPEGKSPRDFIPCECASHTVEAVINEAMRHYYSRNPTALQDLIRRLVRAAQPGATS